MNIAIIGTRSPTPKQVNLIVRAAQESSERGYKLISGGARGTDTLAAKNFNGEAKIIRSQDAQDLSQRDPDAYLRWVKVAEEAHPNWTAVRRRGQYVVNLLVRNVMIVDEADVVYAFPGTTSGGTDHAIKCARLLDKRIHINEVGQ